MKKLLPALFFILGVPISALAFLRVATWTGSEILGVVAAIVIYAGIVLIIAAVFNNVNNQEFYTDKLKDKK